MAYYLSKRYKKYAGGGFTPPSANFGAGVSIANSATDILSAAAPEKDEFGRKAAGIDALKGAASGASMGMAAGPWGAAIGAVVGAGVGLTTNLIQKGKNERMIAQRQLSRNLQERERNQAILTNNPELVTGNINAEYMANGGPFSRNESKSYNPNLAAKDKAFQKWYRANTLEGQNNKPYSTAMDYDYYSFFKNNGVGSIQDHFPDTYKRTTHPTFSDESIYAVPGNAGGHWDGDTFQPGKGKFMKANGGPLAKSYMRAQGGSLKQLSYENVEVEGPSHENGGVQLPEQNAEVEGNETIHNDFVFSDRLGFADAHRTIAKAIGKIEKKGVMTPERVNAMERLETRQENLKQTQEYFKKMLSL